MPIWHSPNNNKEIYVGYEPPQDFLQVKDVFDT